MTRTKKVNTTKLEIIQVATRMFLENGYTTTTVKAISDVLGISTGNLTFYFPTKGHLLALLVDMLCDFQWQMIGREVDDGASALLAFSLELPTMAALCSNDQITRDFYLSAYTHPSTLAIIRRKDAERAKHLFHHSLPNWTDPDFDEAQMLVSGIEYATLMDTTIPFQRRLRTALDQILSIYQTPEEIRRSTIDQILSMDHHELGKQIYHQFIQYIQRANEQMIQAVLHKEVTK